MMTPLDGMVSAIVETSQKHGSRSAGSAVKRLSNWSPTESAAMIPVSREYLARNGVGAVGCWSTSRLKS